MLVGIQPSLPGGSMRVVLTAVLTASLVACTPRSQLFQLDHTPRPVRAVEEVELLRSPPERAYRVIAEWRGEEESVFDERRGLRNQARRKAAALGADAVIVTFRQRAGAPVRSPMMVPGTATEPGEVTLPTTETTIHAQLIVWE